MAKKRQHNLFGNEVEVQLVSAPPITKSWKPSQSTPTSIIQVKGLEGCHNESALRMFFSNKKKCGGGDVTNVVIKKGITYVTFADQKGSLLNIIKHSNHS